MRIALFLLAMLMPSAVGSAETRIELPTASERRIADIASWGTVLTVVALDTQTSWKAPDPGHAFLLEGLRLGTTYGVVFLAKSLIHRDRPCAPDCGIDNPESSFFSGHTAGAFQTIGGPRLAFSLPFAVSTGTLRVAAGKHWVTDTLVGAGVGLLTSRIR